MASVFTKYNIKISDYTIKRWWEFYRVSVLSPNNSEVSFLVSYTGLTSIDKTVQIHLGVCKKDICFPYIAVHSFDSDSTNISKRYFIAIGDCNNEIDDRNVDTFKTFINHELSKSLEKLNSIIDEDFEVNMEIV